MPSEQDPYKSMGHDPRAPANALRKIRHKSNPGETKNYSSSICINCNQPYSQLESDDVNYCDKCASLQIECLECRRKFIPKDNSMYCHHCKIKRSDSVRENTYLKEKIIQVSDFKDNQVNERQNINSKQDENHEQSEWDNPLNCFEPDDNRPKSNIYVKKGKSRKKQNKKLSSINLDKNNSNQDNEKKIKEQKWHKIYPEKFGQMIDEYKISVSNIIFYCIYESTILLDVQDIVDILKGSKSTKILTLALDELYAYSELSHCSEEWLKDFIHELTLHNYLQIKYYSNKKVLILNENSFELLYPELIRLNRVSEVSK